MVSSWWRRLPQKTRVWLIASVLLVFAGTEVLVLAPYILDIAIMIDVGGLVLVLAALRSSVSDTMMQLRAGLRVVATPFIVVQRAGEIVADFGLALSERWYFRNLIMDQIATRCCQAVLIAVVSVLPAKVLLTIL